MKVIKYILGLGVALVLLLLVAIVALPSIINPNDYRADIVNLVKDKTGRELRLDGDLSISVFPWLGVKTQSLTLSQPKSIGGEMLSVGEAQLKVKLLPLLQKRLEIDSVVLKSPQVRFITLASGENSLSGLVDDSEDARDSQAEERGDFMINIEGIELTNAKLEYIDKAQELDYIIEDLSVQTGDIFARDFGKVSIRGRAIDRAQGADMRLDFTVRAKAQIDADKKRATIKNMRNSFALQDGEITSEIQSIRFDFDTQRAVVEQIKNTLNLSLEGKKLDAGMSIELVDADLDKQNIQLNGMQANAQYEDMPANLYVKSVSYNGKNERATVADVHVQSKDARADVRNIKVQKVGEEMSYIMDVVVNPLNVRKWLQALEIDYTPESAKALTAVALSAHIQGDLDAVTIRNIDYTMDESKIQGQVSLQNFSQPNIQFDLHLNSIDVDAYLPKSAEEKEQKTALTQQDLELPLNDLEQVIANGVFKADTLRVNGLSINQLEVKAKTEKGVLKIIPSAKLYEGATQGQIQFSSAKHTPQLRIQQKLDVVDLGKMLLDADITEQLAGIVSADIDLVFTQKNGVQSNSGTIRLSAKDGHIKGIDVQKMIEQGYAKFSKDEGQPNGNETGQSSAEDKTEYGQLIGEFTLNNWVLDSTELTMSSPLLKVNGGGDINLLEQSLDYVVKVSIENNTNAQGIPYLKDLVGLTIPIKLSGDLTAPDYSLDIAGLAKALYKKKLEKKKNEYLSKKTGIRVDEDTSTQDIIKQSIFKKLTEKSDKKKAKQGEGEDEPLSEQEQKKQEKREAKDELKKKLLESIFN